MYNLAQLQNHYYFSFFLISVLSISLSFDVELPNGRSTRHPDANRFIDTIRERLHQAIEIYEQKPLGNSSMLPCHYQIFV